VTHYIKELRELHHTSYLIIWYNGYNNDDLLEKIATSINLKLYDNEDRFSFFAPVGFENWNLNDVLWCKWLWKVNKYY
jgi:hypothetical protein